MTAAYLRIVLGTTVAVVVSLWLYIDVVQSPFMFALGLALGCFLAGRYTYKDGLLFGSAASFPLGVYVIAIGLQPADSNEAAVVLKGILIVIFGALYCGTLAWLIERLKTGRAIFNG